MTEEETLQTEFPETLGQMPTLQNKGSASEAKDRNHLYGRI